MLAPVARNVNSLFLSNYNEHVPIKHLVQVKITPPKVPQFAIIDRIPSDLKTRILCFGWFILRISRDVMHFNETKWSRTTKVSHEICQEEKMGKFPYLKAGKLVRIRTEKSFT